RAGCQEFRHQACAYSSMHRPFVLPKKWEVRASIQEVTRATNAADWPSGPEQFRNARCIVGEDTVAAGTLESEQRLEHRFLTVDPAICRSRLDHRVFSGHLIGECRYTELVLQTAHDVEIRQARLDHQHV